MKIAFAEISQRSRPKRKRGVEESCSVFDVNYTWHCTQRPKSVLLPNIYHSEGDKPQCVCVCVCARDCVLKVFCLAVHIQNTGSLGFISPVKAKARYVLRVLMSATHPFPAGWDLAEHQAKLPQFYCSCPTRRSDHSFWASSIFRHQFSSFGFIWPLGFWGYLPHIHWLCVQQVEKKLVSKLRTIYEIYTWS